MAVSLTHVSVNAGSPIAETINRVFGANDTMLVKQKRKGWLMECLCGCEGKQEYKIATVPEPKKEILRAKEHSSCCIRMLCGTCRPFEIEVGVDKDAPTLLTFVRPLRCGAGVYSAVMNLANNSNCECNRPSLQMN
jgi:hypothetical protein